MRDDKESLSFKIHKHNVTISNDNDNMQPLEETKY